jgi:hygromycin-B 7''-O-kinase
VTREIHVGRLGTVSEEQLQAALARFELGTLTSASAVPFGLFGQNVFVDSDVGSYVLRFGAHYDWQFPTERFFCERIHERTDVPVPWPYLWEPSPDGFGYPWGYVLMPRLPGIATADRQLYEQLSYPDRLGIAKTLGSSLRRLHRPTWPTSGAFDSTTGNIEPFAATYVQRSRDRIGTTVENAAVHSGALTTAERRWIEQRMETVAAERDEFQPVLVHEDFNTNNTSFEREGAEWRLAGLFDLMTAHIGDGLNDLPRQFSMYVEEDPSLAAAYLHAYGDSGTLDRDATARLGLYLLDERLIVWEFFHRPEFLDMWQGGDELFREWFATYERALDEALLERRAQSR